MNKDKHKNKEPIVRPSHSKKPSLDKSRGSQVRLTIYAHPRHTRYNTTYFLSNPNSLEKKKPKMNKKKLNKSKKFK